MNFIMTNVCNLHCPYCFASNITCDEYQFSSDECLEDIINIARRSKEPIRLVGGEPTVHPKFLEIFKKVTEYNNSEINTQTTLFTNGILLYKFYVQMKEIGEFGYLINVNDLSKKPLEMQQDMKKTLELLSEDNFEYGILGCNIHLGENEYNYIFDAIKKYNYSKSLRVSVTTPTNEYSYYLSDPSAYFKAIKPIFMKFVQKCLDCGVKIHIDCNRIPPCLLSYDELKKIREVSGEIDSFLHSNCNCMGIDIDMNYYATRCFSTRANKINIESIKDTVTIADINKHFDSIYCGDTCKIDKEKTGICALCNIGCNFFTKKETK